MCQSLVCFLWTKFKDPEFSGHLILMWRWCSDSCVSLGSYGYLKVVCLLSTFQLCVSEPMQSTIERYMITRISSHSVCLLDSPLSMPFLHRAWGLLCQHKSVSPILMKQFVYPPCIMHAVCTVRYMHTYVLSRAYVYTISYHYAMQI